MTISWPFIALVWHIWHRIDLWRMPCPGRGTSEGKWAIESSIEGGQWHVDKGWHGHCLSSLFSGSVFNWIFEIFKGTKCETGHCPLFKWLPDHRQPSTPAVEQTKFKHEKQCQQLQRNVIKNIQRVRRLYILMQVPNKFKYAPCILRMCWSKCELRKAKGALVMLETWLSLDGEDDVMLHIYLHLFVSAVKAMNTKSHHSREWMTEEKSLSAAQSKISNSQALVVPCMSHVCWCFFRSSPGSHAGLLSLLVCHPV